MEIRYWIQQADYTSTEYDPVDVGTAIRILRSHDWPAALEFEREREAAGLETCPPGIGFVADQNRILHICPGRGGTALVHYHTDEPRLFVRTMPVLVGFGAVVVSGVTASHLLTGAGGLMRSSLGVVTGMVGLYLLRNLTRRLHRTMSSRFEPVVRTSPEISWPDLPELVRRFFAEDHMWLSERIGRPDKPRQPPRGAHASTQ